MLQDKPADDQQEQEAIAPEQQEQEQQLMLQDHQELTPEEQEQQERYIYFTTGAIPAWMAERQERQARNHIFESDEPWQMQM